MNILVTQRDNLYFLPELGGVAVAREPGGREGMGLSLVINGTGWMERNGVLVIILTHRVLISG